VRSLAAFCTAFLCVTSLHAQHQESSLVDRLLRPNMELQNNAQNKKFRASAAVFERRGSVGTFYLQPTRSEKSFADARDYSTTDYSARAFNSGTRTIISPQNQNANTLASVKTSAVRDIHATRDAQQGIPTRNYAEQGQFKERGKSQKSLDRQNPPLTIDQVRELLNKNK
jgi:hypothetical protein